MTQDSPESTARNATTTVPPESGRRNKQEDARSRSSDEACRPPLPPRPTNLSLCRNRRPAADREASMAHGLISNPTTAVFFTDINTHAVHDRSSELQPSKAITSPSGQSEGRRKVAASPGQSDTASLQSYVSQIEARDEVRTLFGASVTGDDQSGLLTSIKDDLGADQLGEVSDVDFAEEFNKIPAINEDGSNEGEVHSQWKAKKKHFLILSAAGKPIYTRHGSDSMISSYVGIIQTIISFYQSSGKPLRSFSSADARFVILSQANLFLVAISRFQESDAQLHVQLEALYLQILSTLTLPNLTHIFSVKPSSDLRRPLQGTEVLLSSLADGFARGSPSTLLSALESLKLRKSHREVINSTFLKSRVDDLLYGLIVAGGRLVSVIRPRKHSLHPGDLQLIFNMLFEAEGIKAGGGESWIPLCLPGFNPNGYLYMFVSFLNLAGNIHHAAAEEEISKEEAVAIILISANKESFESIRSMKNYLVDELARNQCLVAIQNAIRIGRPLPTEIVPGTVVHHFLYKSRGNVQFCMSSSGQYESPQQRRKLFSIYQELHTSVHTRHASVRVHHSVCASYAALAWVSPNFELYCISAPTVGRNALVQNANRFLHWMLREEARLFVIGGAVF